MSIRWTKRPQNFCGSCGYSWYPRGKAVSAACPRCGDASVMTIWSAIFGLIWALVTLPVLLAIRLFYWALMGILLVLMPVEWALRLVAKGIVRLVPASARILGAGATKTASAARRSWPAVSGAVGEASRRLWARCYSALVCAARWVASARDDLYGEGEREVNPVALVAKLLVFTAACAASRVVAIKLVLIASSTTP